MTRNALVVKIVLLAGLLMVGVSLGGCASNVEKFRKKGIALYQKEQYDQALAALDTALKYDEFDAGANTYAGLIYYRAGSYQQACYHFKTALQADPSSEEAKAGLTAALIRLNKPDLALDYLERSSALANTVDDPRTLKSNVKRKYTKQTEENLFLGKVGDRLRIARTYEKLGDYDNALLYYKKAEAMDPENVSVLQSTAGLYEKTGNKEECRAYLAKAYRVDPAAPGLIEAMTRNGLAISDLVGAPAPKAPLVPAPH